MKKLSLFLSVVFICLSFAVNAQQYLAHGKKQLSRDQEELKLVKEDVRKIYKAFINQDIKTAESIRQVLIPKMKQEVLQTKEKAQIAIDEFAGRGGQLSNMKSYLPINEDGDFITNVKEWQMQIYRATRQEELLEILEPTVFTADPNKAADLQKGRRAIDEFIQMMQEDIWSVTGGRPDRRE